MPNKALGGFNPCGIPLDEISEEVGTLEFILLEHNVMDAALNQVRILDIQVGCSRFVLRSLRGSDLIFTHWNMNTGIREAVVSLVGLNAREQLYIAMTWDKREITLRAGERPDDPKMRKNTGELKGGKVLMGKDGLLCVVGDTGVLVSYVSVRENGEEVLSSDAEQIWDLTITRVNTLLEGFTLTHDFLFKVTIAQQCLVMLVTGFETYAKERFGEIERFGIKSADTDELLRIFDSKKWHEDARNQFIRNGGTRLDSILEVPDGKGIINFQNWQKCKLAYNKGYGIIFGQLPVRGEVLRSFPDYFRYRHQIVHSKRFVNQLNIDKPKEEPQFIYAEDIQEGKQQFIEKARDDFQEFVETLHEATRMGS